MGAGRQALSIGALSGRAYDRLAPGLNHLAFHAGPPAAVDRLVAAAPAHGWTLLFPDRHPHERHKVNNRAWTTQRAA
ncbi:hypothetical protein ACSNN7_04010 [Micromonospora sp. URMC 105]|uniref:hypothetical protein n=1 Tax=Micromonospora sp. URMC 105 TaxID=3423413 RepID=UPI003F1DCCAD